MKVKKKTKQQNKKKPKNFWHIFLLTSLSTMCFDFVSHLEYPPAACTYWHTKKTQPENPGTVCTPTHQGGSRLLYFFQKQIEVCWKQNQFYTYLTIMSKGEKYYVRKCLWCHIIISVCFCLTKQSVYGSTHTFTWAKHS